jgi:hypothetical protein
MVPDVSASDEELLRSLLAEPDNLPIIRVMNELWGGPIDSPNFATWRAVDADAVRRLGVCEGLIDSGLYLELDEPDWDALTERLRPFGVKP